MVVGLEIKASNRHLDMQICKLPPEIFKGRSKINILVLLGL